ncbi:MAG: HDOD domain-containing protein [Geobacter sp.]|jgi:HD-like signal output (HDOD) protein|nr:HDOD domain-containing protein [Geobacter sp.]
MDKQAMLETARQMVAQIDDLPTIPVVATQVLQLLDDPDVNVDKVADLMLTDQVMTARVMKMVNSPIYRPSHEVTSLKRALVYLGIHHIKEIALTSSFISAFEDKGGVIDISTFWVHAFGVGMVSKIIAEKIHYRDLEKAYLSGVIHDIGEVVLSYYKPEQFAAILETIRQKPVRLVDMEEQEFRTTHNEVGFCIAEKWNFPEAYREVILYHHNPREAVNDPVLCSIVNLADLFCSVRDLYYGGDAWASFNLSEEEGWVILREKHPELAHLDVERFCYELDDAVPMVKEVVTSIFS